MTNKKINIVITYLALILLISLFIKPAFSLDKDNSIYNEIINTNPTTFAQPNKQNWPFSTVNTPPIAFSRGCSMGLANKIYIQNNTINKLKIKDIKGNSFISNEEITDNEWISVPFAKSDLIIATTSKSLANVNFQGLQKNINDPSNSIYVNDNSIKFEKAVDILKKNNINLNNNIKKEKGYKNMYQSAMNKENALVIGIRGLKPEYMVPVRVNGKLPLDPGYELSSYSFINIRSNSDPLKILKNLDEFMTLHNKEQIKDNGLVQWINNHKQNGDLKWNAQ